MRVFVAVPLDEPVRHMLAVWASRLDLPGRLVPPENWHITLRFIGWVEEAGVERIEATLDQAELGPRFKARLDGLSAFPKPSRAAIAHVEIDRGGEELTALAEEVNQIVDHLGFGLEERPFVPHLTLARIRPAENLQPLIEASSPAGIPLTVDKVALYQSHLRRGGARYQILERFELR